MSNSHIVVDDGLTLVASANARSVISKQRPMARALSSTLPGTAANAVLSSTISSVILCGYGPRSWCFLVQAPLVRLKSC